MHFAEYDFVFTILKSSLPFYAIAQHVSVQNVILCLNLVNVRFLLKIHLRFKSLTSMTSSDYIYIYIYYLKKILLSTKDILLSRL